MQIKHILLAAAAVAAFACQKPAAEEPVTPEEASYVGTVTVISNDTPFDNENIEVAFVPAEDGKTASITIYQIRFVPKMPVTLDVTIPDVEVTPGAQEISLACDNVVPLAMGGVPSLEMNSTVASPFSMRETTTNVLLCSSSGGRRTIDV